MQVNTFFSESRATILYHFYVELDFETSFFYIKLRISKKVRIICCSSKILIGLSLKF